MQNRPIRFGPAPVTNALTNWLNCNVTSLAGPVGFTMTQPYLLVTHIRVVNKTAAPHTISLFIGATGAGAAGTEFAFNAKSVAANDAVDWYGRLRLDVADFLTMIADANTSLVIEGEGEIGIS